MRGESGSNKLTVVGRVDPEKLREWVERRTKMKVELLSPLPKPKVDADKDDAKKCSAAAGEDKSVIGQSIPFYIHGGLMIEEWGEQVEETTVVLKTHFTATAASRKSERSSTN